MFVENVPDPKIADPEDAIVKITSTAICGSDRLVYCNKTERAWPTYCSSMVIRP
jgi:threonine dehydrogenase-like Zn-dependent dehydrogenase